MRGGGNECAQQHFAIPDLLCLFRLGNVLNLTAVSAVFFVTIPYPELKLKTRLVERRFWLSIFGHMTNDPASWNMRYMANIKSETCRLANLYFTIRFVINLFILAPCLCDHLRRRRCSFRRALWRGENFCRATEPRGSNRTTRHTRRSAPPG